MSARHDVRRLLDEARPDLERLSEEVQALRQRLRPKVNEEQAPTSAAALSVPDTEFPLEDAPSPPPYQDGSYVPASPTFGNGAREWLSRRAVVALSTPAATAKEAGRNRII